MDKEQSQVSTSQIPQLPLFSKYGLELEYMIVDGATLNVLPITDKIMHAVSGAYEDEVCRGEISWSNELALHVIEFKTSDPVSSLNGVEKTFQRHINEVNGILKQFHGMLMPTAMHPWMDPYKEMKLWPHAHNPVYESYHRIFDCRGHGWSNLQSIHINLPFSNDEEFKKLHAAIRILLPIMPAIAASSPIKDKKHSGMLDTRLHVYLDNARGIPSIAGKVIPEAICSRDEYERIILQPMYHDISPLDPEKILQHEWLNSRGAIARFDRYTIEIRILDVQECPVADLAITHLIVAVLKLLVAERWTTIDFLNTLQVESLYEILVSGITEADQAQIIDPNYLSIFGLTNSDSWTAGKIWSYLSKQTIENDSTISKPILQAINHILNKGPLARRITKRWESDPSEENLYQIYMRLCHCLEKGELF